MNNERLDQILEAAKAAGVLPAHAFRPSQEERPWPVVLLTALGAWLAVAPLLVMVELLLRDFISRGIGTYSVGVLVLVGAVAVLRAERVPLFVEQLAVPALLVGGGTLGFGLFRDLSTQVAAANLALIACAVACLLPRPWLRVLLGALASGLVVAVFMPSSAAGSGIMFDFWVAWHAGFVIWLLAHSLLDKRKDMRLAEIFESLGAGWVLVTLTGLAFWSGMTFLLGATIGGNGAGGLGTLQSQSWQAAIMRGTSLALAVCAAAWLAHRWPSAHRGWCAAGALILIGLSWLMPSLGAVFLILATCASGKRWRLASAAGLASAWILGSFYYQLAFPLATKAILLAGAGAMFGAISWLALRRPPNRPSQEVAAKFPTDSGNSRSALALCTVAVLAVANVGIWQKQDLIAHGAPVFVELAPVDPRSLMQGDYMRLNFKLPEAAQASSSRVVGGHRPHVVATRDSRGIASIRRLHDGSPLGPDDMLIELTPGTGGWTLVSDAWYFQEGQAERWSRAKYGEFRVGKDGQALLVGLRGPMLDAL